VCEARGRRGGRQIVRGDKNGWKMSKLNEERKGEKNDFLRSTKFLKLFRKKVNSKTDCNFLNFLI